MAKTVSGYRAGKGMTRKQALYQRKYRRWLARNEKKLAIIFAGFFKTQLSSILTKLSRTKITKAVPVYVTPSSLSDKLFDVGAENKKLRRFIKEEFYDIVDKGEKMNRGTFGGSKLTPEVKQFIATTSANRVVQVNEVTRKKIKRIIEKTFGETGDFTHTPTLMRNELKKRMSTSFLSMYKGRAYTIGRTESMFLHNDIAVRRFSGLGIKKVDVVGCTMLEDNSDCGARGVPMSDAGNLVFHPNHIGSIQPAA